MKLSWHQLKTLKVLNEGGKITLCIPNEAYLDSVDGGSLRFRITTFRVLQRKKLIEVVLTHSMNVWQYGLTEKGKEYL